ncbi:MAG TPA: hypothetical protein VEF76_09910 [Patescibacteria group bacterium]|nr:hypothetical protein [Patescibacteria group bacterium]
MAFEDIDDYGDTDENLNGIRRDIREATSKIKKGQEKSIANDEAMLAAFNRVADVLGQLVVEVKGLRSDLSGGTLDKPAKLAPPKQGG